jgi:hypothetical protein
MPVRPDAGKKLRSMDDLHLARITRQFRSRQKGLFAKN